MWCGEKRDGCGSGYASLGRPHQAARTAIGEAVNALTGSKPEARFRFIQDRAAFAHDLDI
jgi:hypothetical protein